MPRRLPVVYTAYAGPQYGRKGHLRGLADEARQVRECLKGAREICEHVDRENATLDEMLADWRDPLYRGRIAVFHFAGHGGGHELVFETPGGGGQAVALADVLAAEKSLQVVFLNACSTEPQAERLVEKGVPAVIFTSRKIPDDTAAELAREFYAELAAGRGVEAALLRATDIVRSRVKSAEALHEGTFPWTPLWGFSRARIWSLPEAARDWTFGLDPAPDTNEADLPEEPFRYLDAYLEKDNSLFFGRSKEIREVFEAVTSVERSPVVAVTGAAGVGKSSLLRAGVIPRLRYRHSVLCERRRKLWGLDGTLRAMLDASDDESIRDAWHRWERELGESGVLLVVLDQVEEVFTRSPRPREELARFVGEIEALFRHKSSRPRGRLVLSFRKEWSNEIVHSLTKSGVRPTEVWIPPLDKEGIESAIDGIESDPLLRRRYKLSVAEELAEEVSASLVSDQSSSIGPILQVLLSKMWARAQPDEEGRREFTKALFAQMKKEGLLLGRFLEEQLAGIAKEFPDEVESGLVLDLLYEHTTARGTADERRRTLPTPAVRPARLWRGPGASWSVHEDLRVLFGNATPRFEPLLAELQGHRVLTASGQGRTRLAHDALAGPVQEDFRLSQRPGQTARAVVESAGRGSEEGAFLLNGQQLARVEAGLNGMRSLRPREQRSLEASRTADRSRRTTALRVKIAFGSAAALIIGLTVWGVVTQRLSLERVKQESQRAQQEFQRANRESIRARTIQVYLEDVFVPIGDDRRVYGHSDLTSLVTRARNTLAEQLEAYPDEQAVMRNRLATAFVGIGDTGSARELYYAALPHYRELYRDDPSVENAEALISILLAYTLVLPEDLSATPDPQSWAERLAIGREAVRVAELAFGSENHQQVLKTRGEMAADLIRVGDPDGWPMLHRALADYLGAEPGEIRQLMETLSETMVLAHSLGLEVCTGDLDNTAGLLEQQIKKVQEQGGVDVGKEEVLRWALPTSLEALAEHYHRAQKSDVASLVYLCAERWAIKEYKPRTILTLIILRNRGRFLVQTRRFDDASKLLADIRQRRETYLAEASPFEALMISELGEGIEAGSRQITTKRSEGQRLEGENVSETN